MNKALTERHNAVVKNDDVVWHLGDFCLDHSLIPTILPKLNGTHYLVMGNHDRCYKQKKYITTYKQYGFAGVYDNLNCFEGKFKLNHFPYSNIKEKELVDSDMTNDSSYWLLHGHVHEKFKINSSLKQINVGVDVWDYAPVNLNILLELAGFAK